MTLPDLDGMLGRRIHTHGCLNERDPDLSSQPLESASGSPGAKPPSRLPQVRRRLAGGGTALAVLLVWSGLALLAPRFLTVPNFLNIFLAASTLSIIAAGMTLVLIAGEIDLSVGSAEALTGSVAAVVLVQYGAPWPVAILAGIGAGAIIGFVNGLFTTRLRVPSFVVTLAMLSVASGGALLLTQGTSVFGLGPEFGFIGQGHIGILPTPVIIAAAVLIVLEFVLRRTTFGLNLYASGGNAEAARLSGVDIKATKMRVLIVSGALAGLAGVIIASRLDAGSGTVGSADLLASIAAVVIGGTSLSGGVGRISGTLLGALLITSIQNGLVLMDVTAFWQQVAIGSLILVAALLDQLARRQTTA